MTKDRYFFISLTLLSERRYVTIVTYCLLAYSNTSDLYYFLLNSDNAINNHHTSFLPIYTKKISFLPIQTLFNLLNNIAFFLCCFRFQPQHNMTYLYKKKKYIICIKEPIAQILQNYGYITL